MASDGKAPGPPVYTRRHWGREIGGWLLMPLTMLMSKSNPRRPMLSMTRVILAVFVTMFARNFPTEWNWQAVAALAVLTFALILETLFALVPVKEMLLAAAAYFGSKFGQTTKVEETKTEVVKTEVTTPVPVPPDNPAEEPDGGPGK